MWINMLTMGKTLEKRELKPFWLKNTHKKIFIINE